MNGRVFVFPLSYEGASQTALAQPIAARGKTLDWEFHATLVGRKNEDWARMTIDHFGLGDVLTVAQYIEEYTAIITDICPDIAAWEGSVQLLKALKAAGFPVAIATSSPRPSFDKKMKHHPEILELIDAVVTGDEVVNGKPAPDIFIEAARRINCDPSKCVAFEDSPFGVEAAHAAGMVACALPDPRMPKNAPRFTTLNPRWSLAAIGDFKVGWVQLLPL